MDPLHKGEKSRTGERIRWEACDRLLTSVLIPCAGPQSEIFGEGTFENEESLAAGPLRDATNGEKKKNRVGPMSEQKGKVSDGGGRKKILRGDGTQGSFSNPSVGRIVKAGS